MTFSPDIQGAEVIPTGKFWQGRLDNYSVCGVVQHYTGAGNGRNLARWLAKDGKVSIHLIICRNGDVIQQVRLKDRAWHAGETMKKGLWKFRKQPTNVNHFTIGIENSNYGFITKSDIDGKFYTRYGQPYRGPQPVELEGHDGVERWWEPYTDKLVMANVEVLKKIVAKYPAIKAGDIAFHSDVSPHRKHDPGPAWPHEFIISEVFGSNLDTVQLVTVDATDPAPDEEDRVAVAARGNNEDGGDET